MPVKPAIFNQRRAMHPRMLWVFGGRLPNRNVFISFSNSLASAVAHQKRIRTNETITKVGMDSWDSLDLPYFLSTTCFPLLSLILRIF